MDKKPSLTFYTNIPTPYQVSFFKELSRLFRLRVVYYAISESNRSWDFSLEEDYEITVLKDNFIARLFQKKIVDFHFSWQIFNVAAKDKSDYVIIMGNYWIPNATAALVLSKLRSKKVCYFSEPLLQVDNTFKYYFKWLYLRILNVCCSTIFCIGKNATDSFNQYGINLPKHMIPYSIDQEAFTNLDEGKVARFRQQYKPGNEVVILSSGALIDRKGMDILVRAVREIRQVNVKLVIIGDGPEKSRLMEICGNDSRIVFAGFQDPAQIPYFYAIADIFAFASRYDGWAVVINEAIAANVPIISSDQVGAAVEMIRSKELGVLCRSESIPEFRHAIERLAADKEARDSIRENALGLIPLISSDYNARRVHDIFLGLSN